MLHEPPHRFEELDKGLHGHPFCNALFVFGGGNVCSNYSTVATFDLLFGELPKLGLIGVGKAPYAKPELVALRVRRRLGDDGSFFDPFPSKPKWMHGQTYFRLRREYEAAAEAFDEGGNVWLANMGG